VEDSHELYVARVREALADVAAGEVRHFNNVDELMEAIDAASDDDE
jgi:hypothetical protein